MAIEDNLAGPTKFLSPFVFPEFYFSFSLRRRVVWRVSANAIWRIAQIGEIGAPVQVSFSAYVGDLQILRLIVEFTQIL